MALWSANSAKLNLCQLIGRAADNGPGPDYVTFMQQRPRKGVSKAISRQIAVETRRGRGMLRCVNGRVPVAEGFQGRLLKGRSRRSETIGKRGLTTIGFMGRFKRAAESRVRRTNAHNVNWRSNMTLIKSMLLGSAAAIVERPFFTS